jgi:KDO2-lipid IV(A) lauroyltransferase
MPGIAIGRPIKNHLIYNWVVRMRERFGGKIIPPQNALKESLRALKQGKFVGIVGDQGMPDSGFSSKFLGRNAWTSPLPALLSIRTGCPIVVATTRREGARSIITCSDFIWPEGKTTPELMTEVLAIFEKSVKERPQDWLWIHNRFKQQIPGRLPKHLRYDSVALIFSDDPSPWLIKLREIYPTESITLFIPSGIKPTHPDIEFIPYSHPNDLQIPDYRFKLVIDFANQTPALRHFSRLSAQKTLSHSSPEEIFNALLL